MNTRDDMIVALKSLVLPELRRFGFKGTFPHLRRISDEVDLLTFQFDRNGGGFVVEVAKGKKEGFKTSWGEFIPANKLRAWDLHPDQRKRIKPGTEDTTESWFRYDTGEDCETVARTALQKILAAETSQQ